MFERSFQDKTVFLTGHTGFKGAWMCEWLSMLGARVIGYALSPPSQPSLYEHLNLGDRIERDIRADVRDLDRLQAAMQETSPDFIFHLAAQSLVGDGYADPVYTYQTNVAGTINVLEAARRLRRRCVVVVVTTDKVYENREWELAYREDDPLGGYDPYSASKACCEIVAASYNRSFFIGQDADIAMATARAGNVIGGGDWANNRIVPDCMRSLARQEPIKVRNPSATRPWQHVLEPLSGYLLLAARMADARDPQGRGNAYNFGPAVTSNQSVEALVVEILKQWPGSWEAVAVERAPHEAGKLNLASDRAFHSLGWKSTWDFQTTVRMTVAWYRAAFERRGAISPEFFRDLTQAQIRCFEQDCRSGGVPSTKEAT